MSTPLYSAINNSPVTTLAQTIAADATQIELVKIAALPAAPNIVTIGTDESAELVLYTAVSGNRLTGCTRGFNGTTPRAWTAGTKAYRAYTAYDHDTFKKCIEEHQERIGQLTEEKLDKQQGVNNAGRLLYTNDDGNLDHLAIGDTFEINEVPVKNIFHGEWENGQFWQGAWQPITTGMRNAAVNRLFPVKPGRTYTASGHFDSELGDTLVNFYFMQFDANKNFISYIVKQDQTADLFPATETLSNDAAFIAVQLYAPGETAWTDLIPVDFMVEEGGTATEYEPYSPIGKFDVNKEPIENIEHELSMVAGKTRNLNVLPYKNQSVSGVTFVVNEDNSVSLSGTSTAVVYAFSGLAAAANLRYLLPAGTYTLKGTVAGAARCYACLYGVDTPTTLATSYSDVTGAGITFTTHEDYLCAVQISINTGKTVDGITLYPQLEAGSVSTLYVTPFGKTSGRFEALEKDVNTLKDEIGALDVPGYYFKDNYLPDRIAAVKEKMLECAGHGDAFIFITDAHWTQNAKNSPALINHIAKNININKVISGGDMGDSGSWVDFSTKLRKCFPGRVFYTLGNHEYFYPNTGSVLDYHLNMYNEDVHTDNAERNYYYYDNNRAQVRYIMLSAFMPATASSGGAINGHETEQVEWLVNDALNVEDGWTIIVCTHMIHYMNLTTFKLTAPTTGGQAVLDALDAYNANESSKGKVACVIQGHTHHDRITHTTGGIPIVIVSCDKYMPWMSGETNNEPWLATRVAGTITEQAFDIVVLDKEAQELSFFRIGGDAFNGVDDDPGEPVNLRTVTY